MKLIQFTQFTTDKSLADQVLNSSSKQPAYTGGRIIPQGAGWKILIFFKYDKLDTAEGSSLSLPDGAKLVYLPKCLSSVYGVTY